MKLKVGSLPTPLRNKPVWSALGAVAAIILVVVGLLRLLSPRGTEAPVTLQVTLQWQQVALPDGLLIGPAGLFPVPGDGRRAYLCAPPAATGAIRVWTTSDAGNHWSQVTSVTTLPTDQGSGCSMVVDAGNARHVVAQITTGSGADNTLQTHNFFSLDGGATWSPRNGFETLAQLASFQGVTYALGVATGGTQSTSSFAISDDGLRTWRAIDQSISGTNRSVEAFWVNPGDGAVLAQVGGSELWETRDQGAHWTKLTDPGVGQFVVAFPVTGQPWHICGVKWTNADKPPANIFECSTDGGQTWTRQPDLDFTLHCDTCYKGHPYTTLSAARPIALADDGAFLVGTSTKLTATGESDYAIYRLLPGRTQWQSLGKLPPGNDRAILFPWSGHTLWVFPNGVVFTATYPPNLPAPTPGPTATPTAQPARSLSWQPGTAPVRLVREVSPPVLAPSPVDGRVAYLCGADWPPNTTDVQPQVWVTTDRAAHWTLVTSSIPLRQHYNSCQMIANDTNAASAVVTMTYDGATSAASAVATFFTGDGGRSWGSVGANGAGYVSQLASMGTAAYMLYSTGDQPPQLFEAPFSSLADTHMWQRLDASLPAPVQRFWLNPFTGGLLAALDSSSTQSRLYQSEDLGKTWSAIQVPRFDFIAVQQPSGASPWHICLTAAASSGQDGTISCTVDGGHSWSNRPALTIPSATACAQCGAAVRALRPATGAGNVHVGLANDGSLLQIASTTQNATNGSLQFTLSRLAPDATQWQSLGTIPELVLDYSATPNSGVLWALPAVGIPIDAQQRPFTADYPS